MDEENILKNHPELDYIRQWTEAVERQLYEEALSILDDGLLFVQQRAITSQIEHFLKLKEITRSWLVQSGSNRMLEIPDSFEETQSDLKYILECRKAISEQRYEEAVLLFSKGLRESELHSEQIKVSDLISLLRTLFIEIELSLGADFAIKWRKMAQQTSREFTEPTCSFCAKKQSEVFKIIAGHGGYICDECVRTCLEVLIGIIAEEANKNNTGNDPNKEA
jgi:hypothetical protein